jgi:hypothetical protein
MTSAPNQKLDTRTASLDRVESDRNDPTFAALGSRFRFSTPGGTTISSAAGAPGAL